MKVSLNWVKEFTKVELSVEALVEKIGAQLGAVESVVNLGERYQGIVIVKVVECKPLEGSDHLSVCRVDDSKHVKDVERGDDGLVQVVCGAPNVKEGMLVAWLPPGATVPSSWDGEHFVLEARKMRGVTSNGMLASAKELAIGDSHEGLLDLSAGLFSRHPERSEGSGDSSAAPQNDKLPKPGDDFAKTYHLDDYVIDIENKMFTHRPDCFGMLGIAREIAGITGQQFKSPDVYLPPVILSETKNLDPSATPQDDKSQWLEIRNEIPELVPRFVAQVFENITVAPSPVWLQTYLSRVGIRPINNLVDITNYFMLLTGQPLHAYDYDKVKALSDGGKAVIVLRNPHASEKLALLNGKLIEPRAGAIVVATDKQAIGLGGVMGGSETEVDEKTTSIILECASFDMYNSRRTNMEHGLFTDAATRFTKGQSPLQNAHVVAWARDLLVQTTGATPGDLVDDDHVEDAARERGNLYPPVTIAATYINERLGLKLSADEMKRLLENVEFTVDAKGDELTVHAPFWRTDIELREDVVEEVGRLYGYDHLPPDLPRRDLAPATRDQLLETKAKIRDVLAAAGANEVLTYSFVHGNLLEKAGQDPQAAFRLSNALSPDLQYYRVSLTPSLLDKVHANIKAGYDEFALFEMGKAHVMNEPDPEDSRVPKEVNALAFVFTADVKRGKDYAGAAYYQAKRHLSNLLTHCNTVQGLVFEPLAGADLYKNQWIEQMATQYDPVRSAVLRAADGLIWGVVGEFKRSVRQALKLPDYSAGFELDPLLFMQDHAARSYVPLPRFPKVTQDISLKVSADLAYGELDSFLVEQLLKNKPENTHLDTSALDIYQGDDKKTKNITIRITIASYERTLTDKEVNELLDSVAAAAKTKFGAERL